MEENTTLQKETREQLLLAGLKYESTTVINVESTNKEEFHTLVKDRIGRSKRVTSILTSVIAGYALVLSFLLLAYTVSTFLVICYV